MNFLTKSLLTTNIILCSLSMNIANASAAVFNFTFDQNASDKTLSPPFVGSGTLSFDGDPIVGSYSLASLSNLDLNFSFTNGLSFSIADLKKLSTPVIPTFDSGISIFDSGSGNLGLTFTGIVSGGFIRTGSGYGGSSFTDLGFEGTNSINNRIGCCGGDGVNNQYALTVFRKSFMNPNSNFYRPDTLFVGNYNAVSAQNTVSSQQAPEPVTILGSLTAFSFAVYSKHKSKKLLESK